MLLLTLYLICQLFGIVRRSYFWQLEELEDKSLQFSLGAPWLRHVRYMDEYSLLYLPFFKKMMLTRADFLENCVGGAPVDNSWYL